jgi:CHAT domain-containing protein
MKYKFLLNIAFFFILTLSFSQQEMTEQYQQQLQQANRDLLHGNFNDAIAKYNQLLKTEGRKNEAELYNSLAHAFYGKFDRSKAKEYAERALKMSQNSNSRDRLQEAIALENLGRFENLKQKYKEALSYYNQALEIKQSIEGVDPSEIATSYFRLCSVKQMQSEYETAIEYINTVLEMNLEATPKNHIILSNIYNIYGRIYYDKGSIEKALANYLLSIDFALKEFEDDNVLLDRLYNDIGNAYVPQAKYYEALKYFEKALSLNVKKNGDKVDQDLVAIHFNIGMVYTFLGRREKALYYTQKTADLGEIAFKKGHENFHFVYSQLGRLYGGKKGIFYLKKAIGILEGSQKRRSKIIMSGYQMYIATIYTQLRDYKQAQEYIKKALAIRVQISGENNFRTIESRNYLASNFLRLEDPTQALIQINKSIQANYIDLGSETLIEQNFEISKVLDSKLFIEAVELKIDILLQQYEANKDIELLKESYHLSLGLDEVITKARSTLRDQQDKLRFTSLVKDFYEKQVGICMRLYKLESDDIYKKIAFEFSEKSKSNVLRELASSNKIKDKLDVSQDIIVFEKEINEKLAKARSRMAVEVANPKSDSLKVYAMQEEIVDLFHQKDSLEQSIEKTYPKYHRLKYDKPVLSISDVQLQLNENTSLVEFLVSKNDVFVFVINKTSYDVKRITIDSLNQKIQKLQTSAAEQKYDTYEKTARQLYDEFFAPIESSIQGTNLIIVPDEALWHLQFDLLLKGEKYLVYDYAISYVNSASFLKEIKSNGSDRNVAKECLAFSFTGKEQETEDGEAIPLERFRNSTTDLPGTRKEIKALSKIFDGTYYFGKSANEKNFKKKVPQYKITHLALHAEVDSLNSENFKILFSNFDSTSENEDNVLYNHELYALKIPSDLVVLSACNTGVGSVNKGEGIMSIGNAFQYAGAKSLLLSRWKISDETTPIIMEQFYQNLKAGMTKGKALQQAKVYYLNNSSQLQSVPYYWGSFYILGDDASIEMEASMQYYIMGGIVLVMLFLVYNQRKKRIMARD